ncbi:MAG TPA: hypothetical protein VK849_07935 [Longimicrobiales bacterium]|nr:hypothetical protein [Longimicrobiales bacterium]
MRHPDLAAAVLAVALVVPPDAAARQSADPPRATVDLEASLRLTRVSGGFSTFAGGTALLGADSRILVGGGGWIHLGDARVDAGSADTSFKLRVSYGGLVTDWRVLEPRRLRVSLRTLWGMGNAKLFLRAGSVEAETGADNFGVVEPEIAVTWQLSGRLHTGAGLGYRAVFGVEDLTGVSADDLRGPVLRLSLALLNF